MANLVTSEVGKKIDDIRYDAVYKK